MRDRVTLLERARYWWEKQTSLQFQWGHPDEWSDAEWYYYSKETRNG